MKVHVVYRCHEAAGRFRLKSYETITLPTMCCERMGDEWGGIIDLGLCGFPRANNICAVACTAAYPMSNGEIIHTATPISHCPWCGQPVEIISALDTTPETRATPDVIPDPNF